MVRKMKSGNSFHGINGLKNLLSRCYIGLIVLFLYASIICWLEKSRPYQSKVSPPQVTRDLDWLKESTISTRIGAYKN